MLASASIWSPALDPLGPGKTNMANPHLEARILAAFEQAMADGEWNAANHLLCALEALSPDALPGSSVAEAYLCVAQEAALPQPHGGADPAVSTGLRSRIRVGGCGSEVGKRPRLRPPRREPPSR